MIWPFSIWANDGICRKKLGLLEQPGLDFSKQKFARFAPSSRQCSQMEESPPPRVRFLCSYRCWFVLALCAAYAYGQSLKLSTAFLMPRMNVDDQAALRQNTNETASVVQGARWSPMQESLLVGAPYSSAIFSVPLAVLADKYSCHYLLLAYVAVQSLCALLTKLALLNDFYAFFALRLLFGIAEAAVLPVLNAIVLMWVAKEEKGTAAAIYTSGMQIAAATTPSALFFLSDVVSLQPTAIFILYAVVGVMWCVLFAVFGSDSPQTNRYVNENEKLFLSLKATKRTQSERVAIWRFFHSSPVFALCSSVFAFVFSVAIVQAIIPLYFIEVQHIGDQQLSVLMGIVFAVQGITRIIWAFSMEKLRSRGKMSFTKSAKLSQAITATGTFISFAILSLLPVGCHPALLLAALLVFALTSATACSGYFLSILTLSPSNTATLGAISHCFGNLGSGAASLLFTFLSGINERWTIMFAFTAVVSAAAGVVYAICGSAEDQRFGSRKDENLLSHESCTTFSTEHDSSLPACPATGKEVDFVILAVYEDSTSD